MTLAEDAPHDGHRLAHQQLGFSEALETEKTMRVVVGCYDKLISGLRDSAVSWAIILPLYWYCEKGAVAA